MDGTYFLMPAGLAQAVINFLSSQPYDQVVVLVSEMQQMQQVGPAPEPEVASEEPVAEPIIEEEPFEAIEEEWIPEEE